MRHHRRTMSIRVLIDKEPVRRIDHVTMMRFALANLYAEARRAETEWANGVVRSSKAWSELHPVTAVREAYRAYQWLRRLAAAHVAIRKYTDYLARVESQKDMS